MNTPVLTHTRKPRFKRVPVENIQLTERDIEILRCQSSSKNFQSSASNIFQCEG
jgi:hypothetical protein